MHVYQIYKKLNLLIENKLQAKKSDYCRTFLSEIKPIHTRYIKCLRILIEYMHANN